MGRKELRLTIESRHRLQLPVRQQGGVERVVKQDVLANPVSAGLFSTWAEVPPLPQSRLDS